MRPIEVKMIQRITILLAGVGLVAAAAGCGGASDEATKTPSPSASTSSSGSATPTPGTPTPGTSGTSTPPANSTTPPPTGPTPTGPPNKPTDTVAPGWVVGTVMAASGGPCYGLVTDDGKEYALHSSDGFTVRKGERYRVRVARLALKIYCGPGTHASVQEHEKIG